MFRPTPFPANLSWHLLQYSDVLDYEFASALAEFVPVTLWKPRRQQLPFSEALPAGHLSGSVGSTLQIRSFALHRGFSRAPLRFLLPYGARVAEQLLRFTANPKTSVLVCTTPYFAPAAELWPGPVVYWLTDLMARYEGASLRQVRALDRRMCRVARLVCPNSERIASYLIEEALCPPEHLAVLPNATGVRSLLDKPLLHPTPLPSDIGDRLQRPIAGVIGNLAENTDWVFLEELLERTPWLSWLFVGPTHWPVHEAAQRAARLRLMQHARVLFAGAKPYTELFTYARALNVAVLPYRRREPTHSGSSTRFYDHLAACHPILATDAVAELQHLQPLLELVRSPSEAIRALDKLRARGFHDEQRARRFEESRKNTWRQRAQCMVKELQRRQNAL